MIVKNARPPMFAEIDAAFHVAGKRVIFAFGDTIYNPEGVHISEELMAHEAVHGERQAGVGLAVWWRRYIADDPAFRLAEEIPAHQAEYAKFCEINTKGNARNGRRLALHHIAKRLASPLYGNLIKYEQARKLIKEARA